MSIIFLTILDSTNSSLCTGPFRLKIIERKFVNMSSWIRQILIRVEPINQIRGADHFSKQFAYYDQ